MEHPEATPSPVSPDAALTPAVPSKPTAADVLSRRLFLARSGYSVAALLALSQWEGIGVAPARAQSGGRGGGQGFRLGATTEGRLHLPFWSDAARWDDPHYYTSMQAGHRAWAKTYTFCDLDGDGREEMFIRGPGGLDIQKWNPANAMWMPLPGDHSLLDQDFADKNMYDFSYNSTIQAADVDGDNQAEIVARFADGIHAYKYNAAQQNWTRMPPALPFWSDDAGWNKSPAYYQTIQFANVIGRGSGQLIGRGYYGLQAQFFNDNGWGFLDIYDQFSDTYGWNTADSYWSTIQYADVDNDGLDEIIARSGNGLEIHDYSTTTGQFSRIALYIGWSDAYNWNQPAQYSTIQCADIDGDGALEILGNGIAGLETFKYNPATKNIELYAPFLDATSAQYGWGSASQWYCIQFADIDGDGAKEMIARAGPVGIMAFKYDTSAKKWVWLPQSDVNKELSDQNGYDAVQYWNTFQSAAVLLPGDQDYTGDGTHAQSVIIIRSSNCVLTYRWDVPGQKWAFCQRLNPDFAGPQENAYTALATALYLPGANGNVRSLYNDLSLDLGNLARSIYNVPQSKYESPPATPSLPIPSGASGFSADDWKAVCWQIYWELRWAAAARTWFELNADFITQTFLGNTAVLQTVGNYQNLSSASGTQVTLNILSVLGNAAWAVLGLPSLGAGTASAIAGMIGVAFGAAASFLPSDGTYSTAFSNLQDQLTSGFNATITGNGKNLNRVVGGADLAGNYMPADYGLLKMFGENILSGVWNWENTPELITAAQRGYTLGCWQALISATTFIDKRYGGLNPLPPEGDPYFPPSQYWYHYPNGNGRIGFITGFNGMDYPRFPDSTYSALFDPVNSATIFPLGVPQSEVVDTFSNGWPQLRYVDDISLVPSRPPDRHPDIRAVPTLKRDAKSDDILVTITVANRGLLGATNVHLTAAALGNKKAPPSVAAAHHFLRSNFPETHTVRFSGLAPGTRTLLTIRGEYEGGTFGGRFRVTLP